MFYAQSTGAVRFIGAIKTEKELIKNNNVTLLLSQQHPTVLKISRWEQGNPQYIQNSSLLYSTINLNTCQHPDR